MHTPVEFLVFGEHSECALAALPSSLSVKPEVGKDIVIDSVISGEVIALETETVLDEDVGLAVHVMISKETIRSFYHSPSTWTLFGRDW